MKSKLFRPFGMVFLLMAVILFTQCNLTDYGSGEKEWEVSENAQIIDSADFQEYFFALDSASMTLRLNPLIAEKYDIKPGNVIISDRGRGMLRKISNVEVKDGELIVTTEPTGLAQVIEKGSFSFKEDLAPLIPKAQITYLDPGVELLTDLKGSNNLEMKFSLTVNLASNIQVKGELTVTPNISGQVDIEDYSLNYLKFEFQLIEDLELTAKTTIAEYKLEKEKSILKIRFPTITVFVGFPLLITPQFEIKLGVNLDLKSELSVSTLQNLTLTAGIEYDNGWKPFFTEDHGFGRNGPVLSNTAEAKIYIKPQVDMLIMDIVSPNLSTELYGLVEADLEATPWWSLYAGLTGNIGCDVSVLDFELASFEGQLFDLRFPLAQASAEGDDPPMADFTISPDSGDVSTNFRFDASNCQDIQDMASDLQVRWDWEGDGNWDTEYSTSKKPTFKFHDPDLYNPILEVIDTDGNTAQISRELKVAAVPNRKPKAKFSVDPPTGAHYDNFNFDASECSDFETDTANLEVQWDWESDGYYDTPYSKNKQISHQFLIGTYTVTLRVSDEEGYVDTETYVLEVFKGNTRGTLIDSRDNKTYKTVQIGDQWWMAENLNVGQMLGINDRPSDRNKVEKYCYDDDEFNCQEYGGLYIWDEAMNYSVEIGAQGICPDGWHIPSEEDWEILIATIGGRATADKKMRETGTSHWSAIHREVSNSSGFTARAAGTYQNYTTNQGRFYDLLRIVYYWTSNLDRQESDGRGYGYANHIMVNMSGLTHGPANPELAYSVRCVKNKE